MTRQSMKFQIMGNFKEMDDVESNLSNKLGSADDENLLGKDNSSQSDDLVLGAPNTVSTQLITPNRVVYVSDAISGYTYQIILKDKNGKAL